LPTDDLRGLKVVVVDELLAHRFFGDRDPLDERLVPVHDLSDTLQVVGVVATVKQGGLAAETFPEMYVPFEQFPGDYAAVALRTTGDPKRQTNAMQRAIASVDKAVPVSSVATMSERMAQSVNTTRFSSLLASLFAIVALILGALGIYSVLSYTVSQRRREIAIRLALGAEGSDVMGDVLRRALGLTITGIVLGLGAAWLLTRALAGAIVGVNPHDPLIFGWAAAFLAIVALIAASVPAYRATRVDPLTVLTAL
jgi:ABC-type antimicrobial peptide transport system permease subunit